MTLTLLLLTVLCTTFSQLCQKQASLAAAATPGKLLFWLLVAGCWLGCAFILWVIVLRDTPLAFAYPLLSLNVVLITLASRFIWQEAISCRQWWGIGCIMLGISLLGSTL